MSKGLPIRTVTFKEGDQVWLEGRNLHLDQPSAKLAPKRHGPFTIKQVLSPITYQLTLPHRWKIHDVFHVDLVTDLQGPPLERTQTEKLRDLKSLAHQYAHDQGSCDDIQISYLETLEDRDNDNLRLAQMLAG
jgi:hypothetical protein